MSFSRRCTSRPFGDLFPLTQAYKRAMNKLYCCLSQGESHFIPHELQHRILQYKNGAGCLNVKGESASNKVDPDPAAEKNSTRDIQIENLEKAITIPRFDRGNAKALDLFKPLRKISGDLQCRRMYTINVNERGTIFNEDNKQHYLKLCKCK